LRRVRGTPAKGREMEDTKVIANIEQLAEEEHALLAKEGDGTLSDDEHGRLRSIEVELDRCWDLLRQRRAKRRAGEDPDDASVRDAETVEGYRQ
jgi:hypothetical protein